MATAILVPVEEYLATVYRPDCEYIDGAVEERNLGEKDHSRIQRNLLFVLCSRFRKTEFMVWPEWRFQTRPTRFRVPDIIVTLGEPEGRILREAPLLCVEILSPEDRWSKMTVRVQEYLDFGVPVIWVIDPTEQSVWTCKPGIITAASDPLKLEGAQIELPFAEIFE